MLLDVIDDVRAGNIDYRDANAIGGLTSQILRSAKLDFDVMKVAAEKGSPNVQPAALVGEPPEAGESAPKITGPAKKKPRPTLSEDKIAKVLELKSENKPLHVICDLVRAMTPPDKKLVAAVFYGKTGDED